MRFEIDEAEVGALLGAAEFYLKNAERPKNNEEELHFGILKRAMKELEAAAEEQERLKSLSTRQGQPVCPSCGSMMQVSPEGTHAKCKDCSEEYELKIEKNVYAQKTEET